MESIRMKRIIALAFLALNLLSPAAYASWNPELGIGLTVDKGNNDRNVVVFDFQARKKKDKVDFKTLSSFSYEDGKNREAIKKADHNSKINYYFNQDILFFSSLDIFHNSGAGIDYRIAPGFGAGLVIARKDVLDTLVYNITANLGVNPIIESMAHRGRETKGYYLLIQEMEYNFNSRTRLNERLDYRPNFSKPSNYLLDYFIMLENAISRKFSFRTTLRLKYDSNPDLGREKTDLSFVLSLGYKLY